MMLKLLCFVTLTLAFVAAAPKVKKATLQLLDDDEVADLEEDNVNDRISGLYVKDGESGQLRFLTGNNNAALNQFITSQQNLLEQLRPTSTNTGTGLGTLTSGTGSTSPIVVNLSGSGTTTNSNSAINAAINASPVADLLPQIIAGAVLNTNRRGVNNRRRGGNRNGNRRRPANGQVYVIRPNNG